MKAVLLAVALLAGALVARGGAVRSLVREGAFSGEPVEVRWRAEYPVDIPGWSGEELAALWAHIDALCFLPSFCPREAIEAAKPARPAYLLGRLARKLAAARETEEISPCALEVFAEVRVPFATKDWVGLAYDGYENEGGNGCHALGSLALLARKDLGPMPLTWFVRDVAGLRHAVIDRLERKLTAEEEGDVPPFAGMFSKESALKAEPDFFPTPEGIRFRYGAYAILPGCYGLPEVTVPWLELVPFCDADRLTELKSLLPKP